MRTQRWGWVGALLLIVAAGTHAVAAPCDTAESTATIPVDPGATPLRIEAQVFRGDGRAPAAGVLVYAHHTGANGLYDNAADGTPRRQAFVRTDAEGRFVLRTGMPTPYPNRTQPAHVHLHLWGEGVPHQWTDDVLFADDGLVTAEMRAQSSAAGRFSWVSDAPLEKGVRVVRRAIRLKAAGDRLDPRVRFGLRTCGAE